MHENFTQINMFIQNNHVKRKMRFNSKMGKRQRNHTIEKRMRRSVSSDQNELPWYFMEYLLDLEGKLSFKLSEPVTVVYKGENLQAKMKSISNFE